MVGGNVKFYCFVQCKKHQKIGRIIDNITTSLNNVDQKLFQIGNILLHMQEWHGIAGTAYTNEIFGMIRSLIGILT